MLRSLLFILMFATLLNPNMGCEDQKSFAQSTSVVVQSPMPTRVETGPICPPSSEDIIHSCEDGNAIFVATVLPREVNAVSPDDGEAVIFKVNITPCNYEKVKVAVDSISLKIGVPENKHNEDMYTKLFHSDGSAYMIAFEVLDDALRTMNPEKALLIRSGYLQKVDQSHGVLYLPSSVRDDLQARVDIPAKGLTFAVQAWFDLPEQYKLGRYDISLDGIEAVDQNGYGLTGSVLCNSNKELKQLTVR